MRITSPGLVVILFTACGAEPEVVADAPVISETPARPVSETMASPTSPAADPFAGMSREEKYRALGGRIPSIEPPAMGVAPGPHAIAPSRSESAQEAPRAVGHLSVETERPPRMIRRSLDFKVVPAKAVATRKIVMPPRKKGPTWRVDLENRPARPRANPEEE